jgi:hypothetical protein
MSIFKTTEGDFSAWWDNTVKPFISDDIEPALKTFLSQFDSQLGKQSLGIALEEVAALATGSPFSTVVLAVAGKLVDDAKTDAQADAGAALATIQSALQITKVATSTVATSDLATTTKIVGAFAD